MKLLCCIRISSFSIRELKSVEIFEKILKINELGPTKPSKMLIFSILDLT